MMKTSMGLMVLLLTVSCGSVQTSREVETTLAPEVASLTASQLPGDRTANPLATPTAILQMSLPAPEEATATAAPDEPAMSTPTYDPIRISPFSISRHNAASLVELARLGRGSVRNLAWSPAGELLAASTSRGIDFYRMDALDQPSRLGYRAADMDFHPDGMRMALIVGPDILLIQRSNGGVERNLTAENKIGDGTVSFEAIKFSPRGKILVASGTDLVRDSFGVIQYRFLAGWNTDSGDQLFFVRLPTQIEWIEESDGSQHSYQLDYGSPVSDWSFSPDGGLLLVWDDSGLTIRETASGSVYVPTMDADSAFFHPGGRLMATQENGKLIVRDIYSKTIKFETKEFNGLAFLPDGSRLLACNSKSGMVLLNPNTGMLVEKLGVSQCGTARISADGKRLLLADKKYHVWDLEEMRELGSAGPVDPEEWVLPNPEFSRMVRHGSTESSYEVLDILDGTVVGTISDQPGVMDILFSKNPNETDPGAGLYVLYDNSQALRWSVGNQQFIEAEWPANYPAGSSEMGRRYQIQLDYSGLNIIDLRSPDSALLIKKPATVNASGIADGGEAAVIFLDYSLHPFVPIVATSEILGIVRLWDAATGKMLASLTPDCNAINGLDFSPEGKYLAAGCSDGTVFIWGVRE